MDTKNARQRYDAKRQEQQRAALREKPAMLARIDELEDSVKYLYQENKELKSKVCELEQRIAALEGKK